MWRNVSLSSNRCSQRMFTFPKPRYLSKRVHPLTQKTEASYQFDVQYKGSTEEAPLSLLLECDKDLTVHHVEESLKEEQEWWVSFLQSFLTATTSYFTRAYTVQHVQRIIRHTLITSKERPSSIPLHVCCIPRMLELIGGQFFVYWSYESYPAKIDIPDDVQLPAHMEEWDLDSVPELPEPSDDTEAASLTHPAKLLDKQRVKEARLKAKLAVYRAQSQMNRFYDKYGDEVSESESDSEEDEDQI